MIATTTKYIDLGGTVYFFDTMNRLPITKENAFARALCVFAQSWTWARMTPEEWERVFDTMAAHPAKGTPAQRVQHYNVIYSAFLAGLGYDGPHWREPEEDFLDFNPAIVRAELEDRQRKKESA